MIETILFACLNNIFLVQAPITKPPVVPATVAFYTHESRLTKTAKEVFKVSASGDIQTKLETMEDIAWIQVSKDKNWYLATPLESEHAYIMSKVPNLALRIAAAKGKLKLSDLSESERDAYCSIFAGNPKPFLGRDTPLSSDFSIVTTVIVRGKEFPVTLRSSVIVPDSGSATVPFVDSEWERLRALGGANSSTENELNLNSVFAFNRRLPLTEKFEFLKEASMRLDELIKIRNRKIAEKTNRELSKLIPEWSSVLGRNADFNQLSRPEQYMMINQLVHIGAFDDQQVAKEWLMANPILKIGLDIGVSAGGMGLSWRYSP
jgi:hypothetical protein